MPKPVLAWLAEAGDFTARIKRLESSALAPAWAEIMALANLRLDFLRTERLDALLRRHFAQPPPGLPTRPIRLAILASSTTVHLAAPIRIAALRRNLHVTIHEGEYGQYLQALSDRESELHRFRPDCVMLAFDAHHITAGLDPASDEAGAEAALQAVRGRIARCWSLARENLGATVIQQTVLPVTLPLLGSNEQRLFGSPARLVARLNAALREMADEAGVHLLAIDEIAARDGIVEWHDPVVWHRAKQEVTPVAAPVYGDLVARLLAALQGRTAKCLVLDLDNTLWGGVIGDDGLEGIVIGQGSALGEAHLAVQATAKALARRGVILAVCSKNDASNARAAFEKHPEMLLRMADISCFVANWDDKAGNLRRIARELNIGTDSLVFLDDNPFERNLVRAELPEIAVPEIPDDDPALMPGMLAAAGYFEALSVTAEDRARGAAYAANRDRQALEAAATDLPAYLRSLDMKLIWRRFDRIGLGRVVQLINKTNQFNLTTRRLTEAQVLAIMADPRGFGLQLRLTDRFGDNGMIAVVIGQLDDDGTHCRVDSWLMSCRVLGRGVEAATLALLVAQARALGAAALIGSYHPTAKNAMVSGHYASLGFERIADLPDGGHQARLVLADHVDRPGPIAIIEGE